MHQIIYSSLAELNQLKTGLNVLGVIDKITKSTDLLIVFLPPLIQIHYLEELFDPVRFSESNKDVEEAAYMQFLRLLNEAEGKNLIVQNNLQVGNS